MTLSRRALIAALIAVTAPLALSPASPAFPSGDPSLVVAYDFDDGAGTTAADSSGNGRTGVLAGPTWVTGHTGGALSFDGSNDRVNLPSLGTFYNSGFTLMAWVKASQVKPDVAVVGSWVSAQGGGPMIWVGPQTNTRYHVTLAKGSSYLNSTRAPVAGAWQHLAATYDGATARFYVDGEPTATKTFTGVVGNSDTWRIGAYASTVGFFSGLIDEVRVYSRALDRPELREVAGLPVGDLEAPSPPTDFAAGAIDQGSVATSWTASSDNIGVVAYDLYRGGAFVGSSTSTNFTFGGLPCATSQTFEVAARDLAGNVSSRTALEAATAACSGGLVASYEFDEAGGETANDSSGNGNHGAILGPVRGAGYRGGALFWDKVGSDRVDLPALGTFYKQAFTLMAWVKPLTGTRGDYGIVGTWTSSAAGGPMLWIDNAIDNKYWLTMNRGDGNYLNSGVSARDVWQHVAATYDGTTARFFVNGLEVGSRTAPSNIGDSNVWRIGSYGSSPGGIFWGSIDEAKVYSRSLAVGELREAAGITGGDITPPSAPTGLTAEPTLNNVTFRWNPSTDDVGVDSYQLYVDGDRVGQTPWTNYTRGTGCSRPITFSVAARDAAGNDSSKTSITSGTLPCVGGLLAAYGFEDGSGTNLDDSSPNGRDARLVGVTSGFVPGRFGNGIALADNGYVDLPMLGTFYRTGFTLSTWLRREGTANDAGIMGTWVSSDGGGPMLWLDMTGKLTLTLGKGTANYLVTNWTPPLGEWHYVAGTYDGTTAKVYVDGIEIGSRSVTADAGSSNYWRMGAYGPGPVGYLNGWLDETRIYDNARTPAQIQADMAVDVTP